MNNWIVKEKKQILQNYFSILLGRLGSAFLSVLIIALLTRILSPSQYGILSLFFMLAGFASLFLINWPDTSLVRYGKEEMVAREKVNETFWARVTIYLGTLIILGILIFSLKRPIENYLPWDGSLLWFLFCFIAAATFFEMSSRLFQTTGRIKLFGVLSVLNKVVLSLFLVLVYFLIKEPTKNLVLGGYIMAYVLLAIFPFFILSPSLLFPVRVTLKEVKKLLAYSWPLIFIWAYGSIIRWIDFILIKYYLKESAVGIYSVAYQGMYFFIFFIVAAYELIFSLIVILRKEKKFALINRYVERFIPQGIFLWTIITSFAIAFLPFLIPSILGPGYERCILPFTVLMLGATHFFLGCFYGAVAMGFELVKRVGLISLFAAFLNIIGDIILVPRFGITGAAIATTIAFALSQLFYISIVRNHPQFKGKGSYLAIFWMLPAYLIFTGCLFTQNILWRVIIFILVISVSVLVARMVHLFQKEDKEILKSLSVPESLKRTMGQVIDLLAK